MINGNNTLWKLFTSIFLLLISIVFVPSYKKDYGTERYGQKGCFSNIRVLTGAVEMYNMDHNKSIEHLDQNSIETLKNKRYLEISYPPECKYLSKGNLEKLYENDDSFIYCTYHGSIKKENGIAKIPASKEYENKQERKQANERNNLIPSLITFITAIIVWFI